MNRRDDDELLASLSQAARRQADADAGDGPPAAAWHRLQVSRTKPARPARARWFLVGAMAAAALLLGGYRLWQARPLTYTVLGSVVEPGGTIRGGLTGTAQVDVRFSDGTRIALAQGGRMAVLAPGPHGARLRLEEGEAHLDVVHLPQAAWTVEAGPFVVRVTGTSFDVRWSAADEAIEVRMRAGSVKVTGPLVPEPVSLRGGQRLIARMATHELRIDETHPGASAAAPHPAAPLRATVTGEVPPAAPGVDPEAPSTARPPGPAPAPAAAPIARLDPRPPASRSSATRRPPAREADSEWHPEAWQGRVAAGESDVIVAEVDRHGVERTLGEVNGTALAALSDAARYARRQDLAARTLMEQRQRFPETAAARAAAFQLGRLADNRGAATSALTWYRRYLSEAPNGPYAAEALGREMLTVEKLSGREAARPFAREYLQRFPDGTYLLQAHSILANR
jgi:TolA-binding protein